MTMHPLHTPCPVCKRGVLPHAMRQHIQKTATMEALQEMLAIVNKNPDCTVTVDTGKVLKRCKHWAYYKKLAIPQRNKIIL